MKSQFFDNDPRASSAVKLPSEKAMAEFSEAMRRELGLVPNMRGPRSEGLPQTLNESVSIAPISALRVRRELQGLDTHERVAGITWRLADSDDRTAIYKGNCPHCASGAITCEFQLEGGRLNHDSAVAEYVCGSCEDKLDSLYEKETQRLAEVGQEIRDMLDATKPMLRKSWRLEGKCVECGAIIESTGKGGPRKKCLTCSPSKAKAA